jgi:GT2 family glycosyltransferase
MNDQPLVSVNILSFNRKNELRNTITKVYEQEYKNVEVLVIDNASTDGTVEMVKKEFPEVQLIQLERNIGIAGWNEGFKVAKGDYVLVLDDDAYPGKNSLMQSINVMKNDPNIGIVAFNIFNILKNKEMQRFRGGWLPDEKIEECMWNYFIGCAFIIKRNIYIDNLFPAAYFICFHELPIVRYIVVNNYVIYYNKGIKAYHQNQNLAGLSSIKEYYHYRNLLNFVLWNLSFPFNLYFSLRIFMFFLSRSVRKGWFAKFIKALFYQGRNLQGYKLRKLNKTERCVFLQSDFIEYKLLDKIKNL